MISAINTALSGLLNASKKVDESAQSIASSPPQDRIIEDIIDIKVAETSFKANLGVIRAENEMSDALLNSFDREA